MYGHGIVYTEIIITDVHKQECFVENTPLVKFIWNYIQDSSGVFFFHII